MGVAFKVICAVEQTDPAALLEQYGDLVALGTVADVMPVTGENRIFLRRGMAGRESPPCAPPPARSSAS